MQAYGTQPVREVQPPIWRLHPFVRLHWRQFEHEWVLFEEVSGQTHCLSNFAAAVMMCFEEGQCLTIQALGQQLISEFGFQTSDDSLLEDVVAQCCALNLVASADLHALE